jgi:hypothetical protein
MKNLSATAAAKVAHKSKADILEAIKSGVMSANKNGRGHWEIDPSELNRVFPYAVSKPNQERFGKPSETDVKTNETSVLSVEVKMLREQLEFKDEILAELRQERDDWKGQAKTLLISNQNQQAEQEGKRRFFGLFKTRS